MRRSFRGKGGIGAGVLQIEGVNRRKGIRGSRENKGLRMKREWVWRRGCRRKGEYLRLKATERRREWVGRRDCK
jgi:hypothetical protein